METKVAVERLTQTKELLKTQGWCRGTYHDNQGRHCIWGAVREVDWMNQDELTDLLRFNIIDKNEGPYGRIGLAEWNDQETRRKRDVIRLIDRTIRNIQESGKNYVYDILN